MHRVDDAIVEGGKIVLSGLPFADGQHVSVVVDVVAAADDGVRSATPLPIAEVRRQLKGGVERFDEPFEPMIPSQDWEMLK